MIIKTLKLQPFAGSADRFYNFNDGLNVILGPNESGKSTLVSALRAVLFIDSNLPPGRFKTQMSDFLPISGGDTISVAAEIFYNDETFSLEKSWGATKFSRLKLQDESVFTSPEDISSKMSQILGLNQGTYENVLIIRQTHLSDTIEAIEKEAQASESIQQILRTSKFKMDGVSVPKLKKVVEAKVFEYFSRWDITSGRPEGMHDLGNEWKNNVGNILEAYYSFRRLEKTFKEAGDFELKLDEIIKKTECLSEELKCLGEYVEKYAQAYSDINKRKNLELQKELVLKEISELKEVQSSWPKFEAERNYLSTGLSELAVELKKLDEEEKNAEKFESQRAIREKYEKARKVYSDYLTEKEKLNELQKVTRQDIDELYLTSKAYENFRIKFEAQKLKLKIKAKHGLSIKLSEGLKDPKTISLKEYEELNSILGGRFTIENDDLSVTVSSGNENVEQIIESLEAARKNYQDLLIKHSVKDESELSRKAEDYKAQFDQAKALGEELKKILAGQIYNDLEKKYEALEEVNVQRPMKEILKSISVLNVKKKGLEKDLEEKERAIKLWQQKYTDTGEVSDIHAEKKNELKRIEKEISQLKALPADFTGIDGFIKDFETRESFYKKKRDELTELKIERAEHEKRQPDSSTRELESQMLDAKEFFERMKTEGESYLLIQKELENILNEIDRDTFEPLKAEVSGLLKELTLEKYTSISMEEVIPTGIHSNGSKIPVDLLSAGTKDILALAVRLGMANFYLQNRSGFIIMDDPLVNLDPGRQRVAVDCIRKIAGTKQIILLTCHPSHAELFGEGIIRI